MRNELASDIRFYRQDPGARRSMGEYGCLYNMVTHDGTIKHCAIGRRFRPKYKDMGADLQGNELDAHRVAASNRKRTLDDMLSPCHRGLPLSFWLDLQLLHDEGDHWHEGDVIMEGRALIGGGLSDTGKKLVHKIKHRINDGYYTGHTQGQSVHKDEHSWVHG